MSAYFLFRRTVTKVLTVIQSTAKISTNVTPQSGKKWNIRLKINKTITKPSPNMLAMFNFFNFLSPSDRGFLSNLF